MNDIAALIRLTLRELLHQRAYILLTAVALLIPWLLIIPMSLFLIDLGKVLSDMLFAAEHVLLSCFLFFIAAPLMARDIEQKVCHLLLTVPLKRSRYILARFGGTALAILPMLLLFLLSSCAALEVVAHFWPVYVKAGIGLSFLLGGGMLLLPYLSLLGLLYLISTASSGGAETLVFLLSAWLLSWSVPPVLAALQQPEVSAKIPDWISALITAIDHILPHLSSGRLALDIAHQHIPPGIQLSAYTIEHLAYMLITLILAIMIFERRDLT